MPLGEMFYARPNDLHVATDLVSDVTEIRQGFDEKEGNFLVQERILSWFPNQRNIKCCGYFRQPSS